MVAKEVVKKAPDSPGVYLMKDRLAEIIYIGKAVSLRKRLFSYFAKSLSSLKTAVMMSHVETIEYRKTQSEHEALILEADLIKKYKPRFNIALRDDKSFPYIKITQEELPRVFIGRRNKVNEKVDYFGPYVNATLLRRALDILRKSFPFCTCRKFPKRQCLNYDLGLCAGPGHGKISLKKYKNMIMDLEDFLTEKDDCLVEDLSRKMRELVRCEKFEEAAAVRDRLEALSILVSASSDDYKKLGIKSEPFVIEAFDISNISGKFATGSMVRFRNGKPDKNNYRRFKIKTVTGANDCAMIQEVVGRRYRRLKKELKKMPDLILIDGGLGQLDAGLKALCELGLNIPILSLAKREELVYTKCQRNPVRLNADSHVLKLFKNMRDESHRFAIKYHKFLRNPIRGK